MKGKHNVRHTDYNIAGFVGIGGWLLMAAFATIVALAS